MWEGRRTLSDVFFFYILDLNEYETIFRSLPWIASKYFWVSVWSIMTLVVFTICVLETRQRRKSTRGMGYWDTRATQFLLFFLASLLATLEMALNPLQMERNTLALAWTDFLWSGKFIFMVWTSALVTRSWSVLSLTFLSGVSDSHQVISARITLLLYFSFLSPMAANWTTGITSGGSAVISFALVTQTTVGLLLPPGYLEIRTIGWVAMAIFLFIIVFIHLMLGFTLRRVLTTTGQDVLLVRRMSFLVITIALGFVGLASCAAMAGFMIPTLAFLMPIFYVQMALMFFVAVVIIAVLRRVGPAQKTSRRKGEGMTVNLVDGGSVWQERDGDDDS